MYRVHFSSNKGSRPEQLQQLKGRPIQNNAHYTKMVLNAFMAYYSQNYAAILGSALTTSPVAE